MNEKECLVDFSWTVCQPLRKLSTRTKDFKLMVSAHSGTSGEQKSTFGNPSGLAFSSTLVNHADIGWHGHEKLLLSIVNSNND